MRISKRKSPPVKSGANGAGRSGSERCKVAGAQKRRGHSHAAAARRGAPLGKPEQLAARIHTGTVPPPSDNLADWIAGLGGRRRMIGALPSARRTLLRRALQVLSQSGEARGLAEMLERYLADQRVVSAHTASVVLG